MGAKKKTWTRAEIQAMSATEYLQHRDELHLALVEGRIEQSNEGRMGNSVRLTKPRDGHGRGR